MDDVDSRSLPKTQSNGLWSVPAPEADAAVVEHGSGIVWQHMSVDGRSLWAARGLEYLTLNAPRTPVDLGDEPESTPPPVER
jgi:hypothetical protein